MRTGKYRSSFINDYVVVDIETTGLSPNNDKIIEIAAVKYINNKAVDEFKRLLSIQEPLPSFIIQLTGITDNMLQKEGISAKQAIKEFDSFIGEFVLIGHNVTFDLNFLAVYYEDYLDKSLSNDYMDTCRLARRYLKGLSNYKLVTLADELGIDDHQAHRALNDVYVCAQLYKHLLLIDLQNH